MGAEDLDWARFECVEAPVWRCRDATAVLRRGAISDLNRRVIVDAKEDDANELAVVSVGDHERQPSRSVLSFTPSHRRFKFRLWWTAQSTITVAHAR